MMLDDEQKHIIQLFDMGMRATIEYLYPPLKENPHPPKKIR